MEHAEPRPPSHPSAAAGATQSRAARELHRVAVPCRSARSVALASGTMGAVPESAAVVRMRRTREAARRREAVAMLRLGEMMCGYAAAQLGDGLSPRQARAAAVEAASELAEVAAALRRLARLSASERCALVGQLTALGLSRVQVARRLGISERTVYRCLRSGSAGETG